MGIETRAAMMTPSALSGLSSYSIDVQAFRHRITESHQDAIINAKYYIRYSSKSIGIRSAMPSGSLYSDLDTTLTRTRTRTRTRTDTTTTYHYPTNEDAIMVHDPPVPVKLGVRIGQ
jgi:hypothetical protein